MGITNLHLRTYDANLVTFYIIRQIDFVLFIAVRSIIHVPLEHLMSCVFYFTAYTDDGKSISSGNFYCDICGKDLNGPIPYKMHLNSKAHKEEVALRDEYSQ